MNSTQYSAKTVVSKKISLQPPPQRPAKEQMRLNGVQRQTARVAIATGATIAAIIGAQTLALLDRSAIVKPIILGSAGTDPNSSAAAAGAADLTATPTAVLITTPSATATKGKPSLNLNDNATATPIPRVGATRKPPIASKSAQSQAVTSAKPQPFPLSLSS